MEPERIDGDPFEPGRFGQLYEPGLALDLSVPEPSDAALAPVALLGVVVWRRKLLSPLAAGRAR